MSDDDEATNLRLAIGVVKSLDALLMLTRERRRGFNGLRDFFDLANVAAPIAIDLCRSCLVDEINEEMVRNLASGVSDLVLMIDPLNSQVRQTYIRFLQSCLEPISAKHIESHNIYYMETFVESLLSNIKELLCCSWTVHVGNQIKSLQEELKFLTQILRSRAHYVSRGLDIVNLLTRSKDRGFLEHIRVMSIKAGLIVFSLYDRKIDEGLAQMMYSSLVKFMAEKIEQMIKFLKLDYVELAARRLLYDFEPEDLRKLSFVNTARDTPECPDGCFCERYVLHFSARKNYLLRFIELVESEISENSKFLLSRPPLCLLNSDLILPINAVLKNLKLLVESKLDLVVPLEIKLEQLQQKLISLAFFLELTEKKFPKDEKLDGIFRDAQIVVKEAANLSCL